MSAPEPPPLIEDAAPAWQGWRPWILLVLFSVLALVTVLRHEMWRDEVHPWQAAIAAESLLEFAESVSAEGHPGLWFAVLYPVSRATTNPQAMQIVHLLIAIGVAAVVLFLSPFPWVWRGLLVFGYFPLYEYCAISRNYAVGALLLFLFCALYPSRTSRPLLLAGVLFVLAQASVYSLLLSFALGLMWIADHWKERGGNTGLGGGRVVGAAAVWACGILVSLAQLACARHVKHPFDPEKITETDRVLDVLATPWRGYVPLPRVRFRFWNSNILDGVAAGDVLQVVLAFTLVGLFASLFVRRKPVLILYLVGTASLVAFSFLVYVGHLRHHGHHLLLLMACLWIWRGSTRGDEDPVPRRRLLLVGSLLVANLTAGLYAVVRDWRDPFSAARGVASHIASLGPGDMPVVGHRDVEVEPVTAYLGRPVYYPARGRETLSFSWMDVARHGMDDAEVLRQARVLARERQRDVLIVFSRSGPKRPATLGGATKVADFPRSIVRSERYELYRLSRPSVGVKSGP